MFCTKCGKDIKDDVEVCSECGAKIGSSRQEEKKDVTGFLGMLLDSSFNKFLTLRFIKVIYVICIVLSIIGGLATLVSAFGAMGWMGTAMKIFRFILAPIAGFIVFLILLILARLWCEILIVLFKIADNVGTIAQSKE